MKKLLLTTSILVSAFYSSAFAQKQGELLQQVQKSGNRVSIYSDDKIEIWITTISPSKKLPWHRHTMPRIVIPLEDAVVTKVFDPISGKPRELVEWKKEKGYYYGTDAAGEYHADLFGDRMKDVGEPLASYPEEFEGKTVRVMVVQYKKDKMFKDKTVLEQMPDSRLQEIITKFGQDFDRFVK